MEDTAFAMPDVPDPVELRLHRHQLRTMEEMLLWKRCSWLNITSTMPTSLMSCTSLNGAAWCGKSTHISKVSALQGHRAEAEMFALENGWNVDEPYGRRQFGATGF